MKLRYTPEAIADLREIKSYIKTTLHNPYAAKRISGAILDACSSLKIFPEMGISVAGKTGAETDLRMLICENWDAFYRVEADSGMMSIAHIVDARQDYMHILFGEKDFTSDG